MRTGPMNIGGMLGRHARVRGDHPALVFGSERLSYRELNARVNRLAHCLATLGLAKGDHVATILPNSIELMTAYWAAAKTGLVVVPMSPLLRGPGLASLLRDSDAALLIATPETAALVDEIRPDLGAIRPERFLVTGSRAGWQSLDQLTRAEPETDPVRVELASEDPYDIFYSSGTTGVPKGIVHTHFVRAMYGVLFAATLRVKPESVVLHSGSIVFNGAWLTLMPWMHQGATYILEPKFDPARFVSLVRTERVTHAVMVPSQIVALLHEPTATREALASLELLLTVGAPLHLEHKQALVARWPGIFYELYGLTEGFHTILDRDDAERKLDSVGAPTGLFEMRIVDDEGRDLPAGAVGEIVGRGPLMMPGYYRRPDLTALAIRDGWLFSGDLGYRDDDGFLHLVDRKKDLIISGGVNVYPRDIEEVVVQHPAVREAAVFGAPDDRWGEAPVAAVRLREPVDPLELVQWVNARVSARFQQIREVVIVEDFPRNTAGKILKRELRDGFRREARPAG
ncbi:MAG: class I adenylate-forming enzyme family protein [Gemmatimonadota bacterium]